jgi:type I restriction enzyme S subunit
MVCTGDVLIVQRGTIGKLVLVDRPIGDATINPSMVIIRTHKVSPRFVAYYLLSHSGQRQILADTSTTGVPMISQRQIESFLVPLPPTKAEQEAIAEALGDADALIESLERLVAKKRQLKQGAMRELLTGKKRLPGFSGKWEVKRLGTIGDISSAGVDKKSRPGETPIRLVNYLDVYRKDFLYSDDPCQWVTAPPLQARRCSVKKGDVFFTPSSETRDDIGISAVAMEDIPDAAYSYHVVRLRLTEQWDLRFRNYAFKTRAFLDQAETLCDGSGTRYVISQDKFKGMTVNVPCIREQTAIATILFDMDAEIAGLETKLAKTRQLKQGMMQELLTGRIRLV